MRVDVTATSVDRREVEEDLAAFEGRGDLLDAAVLQVDLMEFVTAAHAVEVLQPAAAQVVNDGDVRAASDERFDEVASDEARSARDRDLAAVPFRFPVHRSIGRERVTSRRTWLEQFLSPRGQGRLAQKAIARCELVSGPHSFHDYTPPTSIAIGRGV